MRRDGQLHFRWRECGAGEPVLLLHGLMGEIDHWETTLKTLGSFCRPVALELPIFDPSFSEISLPSLAKWVRMFLDAQRIRRAIIGGNSLGGHVAIELALAHPDRVSGLILTGSSGLFERSYTRGVPHRPNSDWVREKMEEVFYDPALVTPEQVQAVVRVVSTRDSALRVLQAARASKHRSMEDCLPAIDIPTCLIWGEEDRITPPEVARRFHALIAGSDLFLVPRCGHAPMLERPEAFNAILASWLLRRALWQGHPARVAEVAA